MKLKYVCLFLILILAACSTQRNEKLLSPQDSAKNAKPEANPQSLIANTDTLTVDRRCAVLYSPDSVQISKRKEQIGEEKFYIGADDYLFGMQTASDFLDSNKVATIDAADKKYVRFISSDQSQTLVRLDTLPELWGIYFFDPKKKAKQIDFTMVEEEYNNYFKQ